jgi:hypothetical protein
LNLPYRRIGFGGALKARQARLRLSRCALKIRDTADSKSALRADCGFQIKSLPEMN